MSHREAAGQVDVDVPDPHAPLTLVGKADAADAFQNGIVANPDGSEFQHMERLVVGDVGNRRAQEARPFLTVHLQPRQPAGAVLSAAADDQPGPSTG